MSQHVNVKRIAKQVIRGYLTSKQQETIVIGYWRFKNRFPLDYEPECRLLSRFIRKGDTVIDLGVNMGQYSSRMARLVGPSGRVIGFEALPSTFYLARRILAHANVELHNIAVSDRHGSVTMSVCHDGRNGINTGIARVVDEPVSVDTGTTVTVASTLLDDALANQHQKVTFIKCDIEGHEVSAFRGAMKLLASDNPVLLIETGGTNFRDLEAMLTPLGYHPRKLGPHGTLEPLEGEMMDVGNVFFVP